MSAQTDAPFSPPQNLVTLTASTPQKSGDQLQGVLNVTIANGWHINSAHPLDEFVIPTTLAFDPATADLIRADFPPHVLKSFAFTGGGKLAVYEGSIAIPFVAKVKGANAIRATLHYQACNDSVCLPPRDAQTEIPVAGGSAAPAGNSSFMPLAAAPKAPAAPQGRLASTFATHGLPLTLLVLFLGGLALNLTPCVFPMIHITIGFFAMQSDGRLSRRLALSTAYVGGLVLMYSTLGWLAALSGKMFGAWLQSPAVLIGFAIAMLVLASSMFGLWEMRVPQVIARNSGGRAGMVGAAIMGLFVGIVAAPCVGPVVVALFGLVAAIAKPVVGFVMFATLGFGLGFPYLVALTTLPKPGEWMEQVKKAQGFVLVGMAFYFVRPLIGDNAFRWGVAASLLVGAAYLLLIRSVGPRGGRIVRIACGALLFLAGAAFALPRPAGHGAQWQRYEPKILSAAASSGKPVIVDFYADWCIPCKELDEKTFSNRAVVDELNRFVRVKADLTNASDPAVQALTRQYAIVGVPTIVFVDAGGHEVPAQRLTGYEPPQQFVKRLQQVR